MIDTANVFTIASQKDHVVFLLPLKQKLTPDEAILVAAWLVAMAECQNPTHNFQEVYDAVVST